jgi:hypothetical protein
MKPARISDEELKRSRNNKIFIDATIHQINKDFEAAGFDAPVSGYYEYITLKKLLAEKINFLLSTKHHRFISMLYRIDIPDHIIMFALDPTREEPVDQRMADVIIERELIKVLTKRYYSGKS